MAEVDDGTMNEARMVPCGSATPALHGAISVGTDPAVMGLSETGAIWVLVVNVVVPCCTHNHVRFDSHPFVHLVAAQGHMVVAVTATGQVGVVDTIQQTCIAVATVDPAHATMVCGAFARHDPGLVVLVGRNGRCIVVNGVGVLPATRLVVPTLPTLDPLPCGVVLCDVSVFGLTVLAAGTSIVTFMSRQYIAGKASNGPSVVECDESLAVSKLSDPILQACIQSANMLVAVTLAGQLMIIVPTEMGRYRAKIAGDDQIIWSDVRTGSHGSLLSVCRDKKTKQLLQPKILNIN